MDLELAGKRALVTGSYRGTGAGVARVLAREGVVHDEAAIPCRGGADVV